MNEERWSAALGLLTEIRDPQRRLLAHAEQALQLQREQFLWVQRQAERAERLQERAETLQARSAQVVGLSRRVLALFVPVIVALVAYLSWLLFSHRL